MGLVKFDNNITSSASEQNLFDITGEAHYCTHLFCQNMASGDTIIVKVYIEDSNAATYRLHDTITISNAQTNIVQTIPYITASKYKVSIQRTSGTDRNYTWQRWEVT